MCLFSQSCPLEVQAKIHYIFRGADNVSEGLRSQATRKLSACANETYRIDICIDITLYLVSTYRLKNVHKLSWY